jgi:hypothetical protein
LEIASTVQGAENLDKGQFRMDTRSSLNFALFNRLIIRKFPKESSALGALGRGLKPSAADYFAHLPHAQIF